MPRPITLFTGQWTDLPLEDVARKASELGYHGLELACWGEHIDVERAASDENYCAHLRDLLERYDLEAHALSSPWVGQAILDALGPRHQAVLPAHVWGDGDPAGVNRRAAEELQKTARAAQQIGVPIVCAAAGSSIGGPGAFPPATQPMVDEEFERFAERFSAILDSFAESGVQLALAVHSHNIASDLVTAGRVLTAIDRREELGFSLDPSQLAWQGIDPAEFVRAFADRIYHVHLKDLALKLNGRTSTLGSYLPPGDPRRGWDYRSLGRGSIDFEELIRSLNQINYQGPLSIECDDPQMDREASAKESHQFLQNLDFATSGAHVEAKSTGE